MSGRVRILMRAASAACLAAAVVVAGSAPAGAVAPDETGWWFKANEDPTGALPVEVEPPNVPEGGLYVANDPSGPAGVSALRFTIDDEKATAATVTLTPSASATVADAGAVVACPSLTQWVAAPEGGRWNVRPEPDCATVKVPGVPSEDGATISWELPATTFAPEGAYDVVLLPDPEVPEPFQVPFEALDDTAVQATSDPASTPTTEAAAVDLADLGVTEEGFAAPGTPAFSAPAFTTPPLAAPAGPTVGDEGGDAGDGVALPPPPPRPALDSEGFTPERGVAVALLVAFGLGLWVLSGRTVRPPQLLGGLGTAGGPPVSVPPTVGGRPLPPRVGGIGRFARPRTQPPTRV